MTQRTLHRPAGRLVAAAILATFLFSSIPAGSLGWEPGAVPALPVDGPDASPASDAACLADPVGPLLERIGAVKFTEDPTGGAWEPWFVAPGTHPVPAPPPTASADTARELAELQLIAANRTPDQILEAQFWDEGPAGKAWTDLYMNLIVEHAAKTGKRNPPRLSREMAIVHTAVYDALIAAYDAKYCHKRAPPSAILPTLQPVVPVRPVPSYPSEHATVAGAMSVILPALFPCMPPPDDCEEPEGSLEALASRAATSRLVAGANYRSDVEAGWALGRAVAADVLAARADDGANAPSTRVRVTGPCNWVPTPPDFRQNPLEPQWGDVQPFIMSSGAQFRPGPPPACESPEYHAAYADVYYASKTLTPRQKHIAKFWEGGQGTVTPPGISTWEALNFTVEEGLSTMRSARVLAYTGVAVADAGIAVWDTKFTYWWDRPVTAIQRLFEPGWMPFLATPPFPGYVSGHSGFSAAAYFTLAHFFPERADEFRGYSTEAALSRYYGGIHFRHDNDVGVEMGIGIAGLLIDRAKNDGAEA